MTQIEIQFEGSEKAVKQLGELEEELKTKAVRAGLSPLATEVRKRMQTLAPDDTGVLKQSINRTSISGRAAARLKIFGQTPKLNPGEVALLIGPNKRVGGVRRSSIAHLIEGGTKPHTLTPKRASVLRFRDGFAKSVDHPGTRGQPFMEPALDSVDGSRGRELFDKGLERHLRKLGFGE